MRIVAQDSAKSLCFALVGCGRIAARHAEHIHRLGRLVAVCDTERDKAVAMAEQYGSRWYGDLAEMLVREEGNIDVVSVCTPNGLHAEHTILALRAGCHVLCEKPMALCSADCGQMIVQAERANRRLFIVKQNRFNPPVVAVKRLVDEGRLGQIYSLQLNCFWNRNADYYRDSWKGTAELDGGCLYTQFSHFIDLVCWIAGDVKSARAFTRNLAHEGIVEFEDCGVVTLEFCSGAIGSIHFTINAHAKNMEGSLTIFAEKGTVKIGGQYLNELEYQSLEGPPIANLPAGRPANQYGTYVGSMSNHDKVYENLIDVLTNGGVISTNGFEGLKTVEVIEMIYAAAQEEEQRVRSIGLAASRPSRFTAGLHKRAA
jgi:predicted dehydrogenase